MVNKHSKLKQKTQIKKGDVTGRKNLSKDDDETQNSPK